MKTPVLMLMAISMLVVYSCSKDKDGTSSPPATVGYTAKVDGQAYVGEHGRIKIDSPIALLKIGKHMKLISNMGQNKGMLVAIELVNNKLQPGTYSFNPRANGTLEAYLFYSEDLDKPTSINYASYYVSKTIQGDGQVTINTVTDSSIIGTFHGKALTAFGQVSDTLKDITEGKIYIKL
jgi:hypothetical protein